MPSITLIRNSCLNYCAWGLPSSAELDVCWCEGQGMRSGGQGTGAGCAINVGTLLPGITTETSLALADIWDNEV